ncbi:MAG: aminotransferase class IV [Bacillota bacterium]|nr:aminotransferase class IV [Bacillota bacterium]
MPGFAWVNGRLVPETGPCLGIKERGFLYGDGLFETVRVYRGKPFAWRRHRARLAAGCEALKIPDPGEELEVGMRTLLEAWGITGGSIRITVTRGEAPRGLLAPPETEPTVVITAHPGEPYPAAAYARGFRAVTVSFSRNHLSPLVRLKSLNYLENILGRQEAAAAGADEGIFLNLKGEVTEGTFSNIFLVFGRDSVVTPPPESGLLPGITREIILFLAGELGFSVAEKTILPQDFEKAREAFLTNSLFEVMPLIALDGAPIGAGRPGPVAGSLRGAYRNYVEQNLF